MVPLARLCVLLCCTTAVVLASRADFEAKILHGTADLDLECAEGRGGDFQVYVMLDGTSHSVMVRPNMFIPELEKVIGDAMREKAQVVGVETLPFSLTWNAKLLSKEGMTVADYGITAGDTISMSYKLLGGISEGDKPKWKDLDFIVRVERLDGGMLCTGTIIGAMVENSAETAGGPFVQWLKDVDPTGSLDGYAEQLEGYYGTPDLLEERYSSDEVDTRIDVDWFLGDLEISDEKEKALFTKFFGRPATAPRGTSEDLAGTAEQRTDLVLTAAHCFDGQQRVGFAGRRITDTYGDDPSHWVVFAVQPEGEPLKEGDHVELAGVPSNDANERIEGEVVGFEGDMVKVEFPLFQPRGQRVSPLFQPRGKRITELFKRELVVLLEERKLEVESFMQHTQYNRTIDAFDVGVLKIKQSPHGAYNTRSKVQLSLHETPLRTAVTVGGFGKRQDGKYGGADGLRTATLRTIRCPLDTPGSNVCAESSDHSRVGTCGGDSGAPFWLPRQPGDPFVITGFNSFGYDGDCGELRKKSAIQMVFHNRQLNEELYNLPNWIEPLRPGLHDFSRGDLVQVRDRREDQWQQGEVIVGGTDPEVRVEHFQSLSKWFYVELLQPSAGQRDEEDDSLY